MRIGGTILVPTGNRAATIEEAATAVTNAALTIEEPLAREAKPLRYRVKRGDTLWNISKRFNTTVAQIRKWNGLGATSTIRAGRRLILYVNAEQS